MYDGMNVIQERDGNNNVLVTYTRGLDFSGSLEGAGGIGGLLVRADANGLAYYHSDGGGNITALINPAQAVVARCVYDPFGNQLGQSGPLADVNTYRFSSKDFHPNSGLYYYGFRFYEPNMQRWISRDPIGEAGGINLYEFVKSDPGNKSDSEGLFLSHVHASITRNAVLAFPRHFTFADRMEIIKQAVMIDFQGTQGTAPELTAIHAMAGIDPQTHRHQSPEEARKAYEQYISERLAEALSACDRSTRNRALGSALHAIQDSWAIGHTGFKPWGGGGLLGFPGISHMWHDMFPKAIMADSALSYSVEFLDQYVSLSSSLK